MGPECHILRGLGRRRAIAGVARRGLAVCTRRGEEYVDMPWMVDMPIQACIQGKMEVKRLSTEGCNLALLPLSEKTVYRGYDTVSRTVGYDSQVKGQGWLAHSQSYRA